jgi:bacterioferritin
MLGRLRVGETVEEILKADLEIEYEAAKLYREGADYCDSVRDYVSRDLFVEVLRDEEGHIDFLETQFEMIARMGLQNYIQLQSEPAGAHG